MLIDEFLFDCEVCNTRVKIDKCKFMREVVEYLEFQVGYQQWKPVDDKVAPLLKATIRDHPLQGMKDIRAFIGSCNFYLRQIRNFTYSSVLLKNLTKKRERWEWTQAHQAEFEQLKSKLSSLSIFGVPRADGELVLFPMHLMRAVEAVCISGNVSTRVQLNEYGVDSRLRALIEMEV